MKKISLFCDNPSHPVYPVLHQWCQDNKHNYEVELVSSLDEIREQGDFLFLVSCSEIIDRAVRSRFRYALVLHASDLPNGRGWSPHIWAIINGASHLTLCLIEANDSPDSGRIYLSKKIPIFEHELYDEINAKLFSEEIALIEEMLTIGSDLTPKVQPEAHDVKYYQKRHPRDSALDVEKPLKSQFNLLRVCDPFRFPAFFDLNGYRYSLKIEKIKKLKS